MQCFEVNSIQSYDLHTSLTCNRTLFLVFFRYFVMIGLDFNNSTSLKSNIYKRGLVNVRTFEATA